MEILAYKLFFTFGIIVIVALMLVILALVLYIKTLTDKYFEVIEQKEEMKKRHSREIGRIRDEEKGIERK